MSHLTPKNLVSSGVAFPMTPEKPPIYDLSVHNLTYKVRLHAYMPGYFFPQTLQIWLYIWCMITWALEKNHMKHWFFFSVYDCFILIMWSDHTLLPSYLILKLQVVTRAKKETEEKTLLNNVSVDVHQSELLAIAGPSGSSKTTFLDALAGRINPKSLKGQILVNGKPMDSAFKRVSGYVMQVYMNLL